MFGMVRFVCILSFVCCIQINAQTQSETDFTRHKIGFEYGQGSQLLMNVKYHYVLQLFQFQYGFTLFQRSDFALELLVQPQFNLTKFRQKDHVDIESKGFEFGTNCGLLLRKNKYKNGFSIYVGLSVGPHYVSGTPGRQSKGFIFSDNLFVGFTSKIDKTIYVDVRPGFRHISNANLVKPNRGINNFILNAGFFILLERNKNTMITTPAK